MTGARPKSAGEGSTLFNGTTGWRRRLFTVLSRYLTAERADISCASLSASLGIPASSVKRLLHHLRERYRDILRHEVAQTVESAAEVDEEIRYLCAALATSPS